MDGRAVQQIQMLSNFLEIHFPLDTKLESDMHRRLSYLTVLPTVDMSSPLLSSAVNSLCLAHFGSKDRDQRLLHASQDSYGHVLGSLVQALRYSPHQASPRDHRDVIASIMLISLYEENAPSGRQPRSPSNFATHFMGALKYIENIGTSCLDLSTLFDTRLYQNLRMPALVFSIARRKALVFGRPEWKSLDSSHMQSQGSSSWFPLMTAMPQLLERADTCMDSAAAIPPAADPALMSVIQDIHHFRGQLLAWLDDEFGGRVAPANKGIAAVGINDLESFDMSIEEHCFMTTSETFKSFHNFLGGPGQVLRCSMSWMACLILDTTLLRILVHNPSAQSLVPYRSMQDIEQDAFKSAVELCRCVYHYSKLSSIAYADFLGIYVEMCRNFFEDFGAMREMGWCQACLIAIHVRESRMRCTTRPTLCRVRDVTNELVVAARYRGRRFTVYET